MGITSGSSEFATTYVITQEMANNTDYPYIGICFFYTSGEAVASDGFVMYDNLKIYKGTYTSDTMPDYEPYGYKIPIKVNEDVYNIYLDEPLRKIGDDVDYIDFANKQVIM